MPKALDLLWNRLTEKIPNKLTILKYLNLSIAQSGTITRIPVLKAVIEPKIFKS